MKIKENEKRYMYLDLNREQKSVEHEGDNDINCNWPSWTGLQRLGKEAGRVGNHRKNRDDLDNSIVKIGQYTELSPGDLRRLAIIQTSVKDHLLMLV